MNRKRRRAAKAQNHSARRPRAASGIDLASTFSIGARYFHAGRLDDAEAALRAAVARHPTHGKSWYLLGLIKIGKRDHDAALELLQRAVACEPDSGEAQNDLGAMLQIHGRLEEAAACYRRAISLMPNHAEANFNLGVTTYDLGQPDEAIACYQRAIALRPTYHKAHNNLGVALEVQGKLEEAAASYRRALAIRPDYAEAHNHLGSVLQAQSKSEEAVASCRRAIAIKPDLAEAHNNLALALQGQGKLDEAVASCRRAIAIKPELAEAHCNLGSMLQIQRKLEDAVASFRRALAIRSDYAKAHNNLGIALEAQGNLEEAVASCRRAVAIKPDLAEAHCNLGGMLQIQGKLEDAVASCRRAIAIEPDLAEAHNNLGVALEAQGKLDEAVTSCRRALVNRPDYAEAHSNLGLALQGQGQLDEAIESYRRALALKPDFAAAHTNLIFALNFDLAVGPEQQGQERARWYEQHGRRFAAAIPRHANSPEPERRLRVGYVSGHFRRQAATYAFAPILLNHDPTRFEVVCYSGTVHRDDLTQAFQARAELWRDTRGWPDGRLAETIRADGIDILVDLAGHMSGNRLLVFARKPAPIQVTGWGEPTGTGLRTMDYLFADPFLAPPAQRALLVEEVVDLPGFLGYWTPDSLPDPGPLPALANGYVTFGSFNRLAKVSDTVLRCWGAILQAMPRSSLVLKDRVLGEPSRQARVRAMLAAEGITPERLTLLGSSDRMAHFAAYRMLDIALDPFPHGGGMTTLDALWMGIPVVTAPGSTISSRLAAASLTALGLTDFIAADRSAYVALAVATATNLNALARLRRELRDRLARSAIGDPVRYVGAVETAYRVMWRRWCAASNAHSG